MYSKDLINNAESLLSSCRSTGLKVATAESCTGGLLSALLTEIPGSSDVLDRGFVTYSYGAKTDLLGVDQDMLMEIGAVNEETARAMAEGALKHSDADVAVSITGVAGPGGGSADKPVGLVHFAASRKDGETVAEEHRFGDLGRSAVRLAAVQVALRLLRERL